MIPTDYCIETYSKYCCVLLIHPLDPFILKSLNFLARPLRARFKPAGSARGPGPRA